MSPGVGYIVIKRIWEFVLEYNKEHYNPFIKLPPRGTWGYGYFEAYFAIIDKLNCESWDHEPTQFAKVISSKFPSPSGKDIDINMMPLKMDKKLFKDQLPEDLWPYIYLLDIALTVDKQQEGTICFLTIQESFVEKGKTQRRPGVHIEFPGKLGTSHGYYDEAWGGGYGLKDGMFIATNLDDTCAIWDVSIEDKKDGTSVIGSLGDLEHLKNALPRERMSLLKGRSMYWLTDRTPHEALPMKESGRRIFFRLVSNKLGMWYESHSTKNPIGIVPDPKKTRIIKENKFTDA